MDEETGNVPAKSEVEIEREDARQLQQEVERGLAEEPEVIVNPRPVPHIKIQDIEFESIDSTRGSSFDSGGPGGPPSNVNDNIGENGLQSKFACGTWIRNNCTHIRITLILSLLLTLAVTIYMMYTAFTYHYRTEDELFSEVCSFPELVNNGICDLKLKYDENCNFDGDDCSSDLIWERKKENICEKAASVMGNNDCSVRSLILDNYPYCIDYLPPCVTTTTEQPETTEPQTVGTTKPLTDGTTTTPFPGGGLSSTTTGFVDFDKIMKPDITTPRPPLPVRHIPPRSCPPKLAIYFHDEFCQDELNIDSCDFDGGDCCIGTYESKLMCDECECKTGNDDIDEVFGISGFNCTEDSPWWNWIGDGQCDHALNVELCRFDGGDCLS